MNPDSLRRLRASIAARLERDASNRSESQATQVAFLQYCASILEPTLSDIVDQLEVLGLKSAFRVVSAATGPVTFVVNAPEGDEHHELRFAPRDPHSFLVTVGQGKGTPTQYSGAGRDDLEDLLAKFVESSLDGS